MPGGPQSLEGGRVPRWEWPSVWTPQAGSQLSTNFLTPALRWRPSNRDHGFSTTRPDDDDYIRKWIGSAVSQNSPPSPTLLGLIFLPSHPQFMHTTFTTLSPDPFCSALPPTT